MENKINEAKTQAIMLDERITENAATNLANMISEKGFDEAFEILESM